MTDLVMVEPEVGQASVPEESVEISSPRWYVASYTLTNIRLTLHRKYLDNIRKRSGPFTADRDEYDAQELKEKIYSHERQKILWVHPFEQFAGLC
jgi:hypothetical protein